MKWLYSMIAAHGQDYNFSDPSREWLKQRVATFDMTTRRDRSNSVWWEDVADDYEIKMTRFGVQTPLTDSNGASSMILSRGLTRPLQQQGGGAVEAPRLMLEEVLNSQHLLSDFKEAMDDGYSAHNIEFLENVQALRDNVGELNTKDQSKDVGKERDGLLFDTAVYIYTQFVSKETAGDNLINVSEEIRKRLQDKLTTQIKKTKARADCSLLGPDAYQEAVDAVKAYVSENIWPDFIQTDEYAVLCANQLEALSKPAGGQKKESVSSEGKSAGYDFMHTVPRIPYHTLLPKPFPPWLPARSWQSVTVTITAGRGPMTQHKTASQLYLLSTSGSRTFKGSPSNGAWNESFTLPVTNTTQYVSVAVCHGTKCIGFVPIALAELNAQPVSTSKWYPLRTEEYPGPCTGPGLSTTVDLSVFTRSSSNPESKAATSESTNNTDTTNPASESDSSSLSSSSSTPEGSPSSSSSSPLPPSGSYENEIQLSWSLSEDEAPSTSEKHKNIYADETATGGLGDFIRGKVSKKKKRYMEDNFNLDLTYIVPGVIAMGFPSEGTEGLYRNPLKQVQQFFLLRHPNAYRIYNLCSERDYEPSKFENRVRHFPFDDHNPPPFSLIKAFCEDARVFLSKHPQNVISVHCKAGKGRTGTMIASYFVYAGMGSAADCLAWFGRCRTSNSKGVTIPSQIRYVGYFDHYCRLRRAQKLAPGQTTLFLSRVYLRNLGKTYANSDISFTILQPSKDRQVDAVGEGSKERTLQSRKFAVGVYDKAIDSMCWDLDKKMIDLYEDFRLEFTVPSGFSKEKLFQCWINTRYIKYDLTQQGEPRLRIPKQFLDKACKDTKHKRFSPDMYLELVFSNTATASSIKDTELFVGDEVAAMSGSPLASTALNGTITSSNSVSSNSNSSSRCSNGGSISLNSSTFVQSQQQGNTTPSLSDTLPQRLPTPGNLGN